MTTPEPGAGKTVTIPLRFLDEDMAKLKDCELRVLLSVARQTEFSAVAQIPRNRRQVWISHAWLKRKTGRSNSSVSNAIDALVLQGYIEVTDAVGNPLTSRKDRQLSRGRMYFSLLESVSKDEATTQIPEFGIQKAESIKHAGDFNIKKSKLAAESSTVRIGGWQRAGDIFPNVG